MPRKHEPVDTHGSTRERNQAGCRPFTLAENDVARVQQCSHCETVSVHLGAISLRFHASALESLWNVLGLSLMKLHQEAQREAAVQLSTMGRPGEA